MSFCVPLMPLAATDAGSPDAVNIGGKARSLIRLAQAGLSVPPAFAISAQLYRLLRRTGPPLPTQIAAATDLSALENARAALLAAPLPGGFAEELAAHLRQVDQTITEDGDGGGRFSVRSSFASEDRAGALAAGLFESRVNISLNAVEGAIRTVLASALTPAAYLYARRHHTGVDDAGMAVVVHPYVAGVAAGSAAWDPSGAAPPTIEGLAPATAGAESARTAGASIDQAVRRLAQQQGAVEIEWVATDRTVVYLQLRPFAPPAPTTTWPGWAVLADGPWRWDAAHNPLPLSPAQSALIAIVDRRCQIGIRQRVAAGYLFYEPAPPANESTAVPEALTVEQHLSATRAKVDGILAALGPAPALPAALEAFVAAYQVIMGQLQPAARRARQALKTFLAERQIDEAMLPRLLDGVPSLAGERAARAARIRQAGNEGERAAAIRSYLEKFGDETPVWDVAVPTLAEDRRLVRGMQAAPDTGAAGAATPGPQSAASVHARLPAADRSTFDALLSEARSAVAAGEEDDHLYARVQATLRRALLAEGARLQASGVLAAADDVFWLSLPSLLDNAAGEAPIAPATVAAQARAAYQAALRLPPPASTVAASALETDRATIVGKPGAGGRVVGSAFLYPDPAGALPDVTSIVVARTLLPTELPLLAAAALVTETGGVLDHVAAQARERRIPAVVGAASACQHLRTGDRILVDGDRGIVIKL
ncbi:MAG TPA: PEP/pyruvate-binding domain-containing protein [Polyangia bacterium]|nr:PEP/pyruvate-binding domain-containing protein [Polyangia bacterium]